MKSGAVVLFLALASVAPARAATCPQEAQLWADPRWAPGKGNNCHLCVFNIVTVGPGSLLRWNGDAVTENRLAHYLGLGANLTTPPVSLLLIHNGANGADCALLARVVAVMERSGKCYGDHCAFGLAPPRLPRR